MKQRQIFQSVVCSLELYQHIFVKRFPPILHELLTILESFHLNENSSGEAMHNEG